MPTTLKVALFVLFIALLEGLRQYWIQDPLPWCERSQPSSSDGQTAVVRCINWSQHLDLDCLNQRMRMKMSNGKLSMNQGETVILERSQERKEIFQEIYDKSVWKVSGESTSGLGSTLTATRYVKEILNRVIEELKLVLDSKVITFLDSSCGDMNWMAGYLRSRNDIDYTGYDIVTSNIEEHLLRFSNETWKFEQHDLVTDDIKVSYDLILCRHTLFHLKNDDVFRVLKNFHASGSRYLLMTTESVDSNVELEDRIIEEFSKTGRYRPLNFFQEPFNLPAPICLDKDTDERGMYIALFDLNTMMNLNELQ